MRWLQGVTFGEKYVGGGFERGFEILTRTSAKGNKLRHVFNKNFEKEESKDTVRFRGVTLSPSGSRVDEDAGRSRFFVLGVKRVCIMLNICTLSSLKCHPQSSPLKLIP